MNWSFLGAYRDFGLLFLRLGLGVMMVMHGWPKLAGGQAAWERVGAAMQHLGIGFWPAVWGFLAAMAETLGGALLVIGFLTRPAALMLTVTMIVATVMSYRTSGGVFLDWAHPAELGVVFLSLVFIGAGRYSVDRS
jgi:putative oxidoreductase